MKIDYKAIGIIHSPFKHIENVPVQPAGAANVKGTIEILPQFVAGLKDLEGFSHIILLYFFHLVQEASLIVTPFLDSKPHGIFATRAPCRPNPIGLSVVRLIGVEQNILHVENVDILEGTPLLDIKPYIPEIDQHPAERIGWLAQAKKKFTSACSDNRFR